MNGGRLSASAERLEIHESADWLPQQVEAEIAGLAVRLGDAAAQGTNALTAALLAAAESDATQRVCLQEPLSSL